MSIIDVEKMSENDIIKTLIFEHSKHLDDNSEHKKNLSFWLLSYLNVRQRH